MAAVILGSVPKCQDRNLRRTSLRWRPALNLTFSPRCRSKEAVTAGKQETSKSVSASGAANFS